MRGRGDHRPLPRKSLDQSLGCEARKGSPEPMRRTSPENVPRIPFAPFCFFTRHLLFFKSDFPVSSAKQMPRHICHESDTQKRCFGSWVAPNSPSDFFVAVCVFFIYWKICKLFHSDRCVPTASLSVSTLPRPQCLPPAPSVTSLPAPLSSCVLALQ